MILIISNKKGYFIGKNSDDSSGRFESPQERYYH